MKHSKKISYKKYDNEDPLAGDLSELIETGNWQRVRFELKPKNRTITIRVNQELLVALKRQADKMGLNYQKFIRLMLERLVLKV